MGLDQLVLSNCKKPFIGMKHLVRLETYKIKGFSLPETLGLEDTALRKVGLDTPPHPLPLL